MTQLPTSRIHIIHVLIKAAVTVVLTLSTEVVWQQCDLYQTENDRLSCHIVGGVKKSGTECCDLVPVRDKAAVEQCHHSGCVCLALHCLLVCHAPHWLGRVRLRAPQDLLHSGLQQGRQVYTRMLHTILRR